MELNTKRNLISGGIAALVFSLTSSAAMAAPVTGAIFTTLKDGSAVNHNIYNSKEDVYLNGGPGAANGPCSAAGLPDGVYYFQVTDPSGKYLLSPVNESPEERKVKVYGGKIINYLGSNLHPWWHQTGIGKCGITVQLYPFHDTPNPGGEYKVWITPAVIDSTGQPVFGGAFIPSKSKTDNFKAPGDDAFDDDNDNLSNGDEIELGTNPLAQDTDGDGFNDDVEVEAGTNPLDRLDFPDSSGCTPDGCPG
jgi:hypothetical protein